MAAAEHRPFRTDRVAGMEMRERGRIAIMRRRPPQGGSVPD